MLCGVGPQALNYFETLGHMAYQLLDGNSEVTGAAYLSCREEDCSTSDIDKTLGHMSNHTVFFYYFIFSFSSFVLMIVVNDILTEVSVFCFIYFLSFRILPTE